MVVEFKKSKLPTLLHFVQVKVPYQPHVKSFKRFGLYSPNRSEIDLSNEVLNIDFGQGAAKISEVKVGG